MKVQADKINGVYIVSEFEVCDHLLPNDFYDELFLNFPDSIGTDLSLSLAKKIHKEFGINRLQTRPTCKS